MCNHCVDLPTNGYFWHEQWPCIELSLMLIVSSASAWRPSGEVECNVRNFTLTVGWLLGGCPDSPEQPAHTAFLSLFAIAMIVRRPQISPLDYVITSLKETTLAVAVACMSIVIAAGKLGEGRTLLSGSCSALRILA
eukprot:gene2894-biopygen537